MTFPSKQEVFIGYCGTGCDIEFEEIRKTEKAVYVKEIETGIEIWLPKFIFDGSGSILQENNHYFFDNFAEKSGDTYERR